MAACILFLAGPGGLFLNSQVLYPDGGKMLGFMNTQRVLTSLRKHFGSARSHLKIAGLKYT